MRHIKDIPTNKKTFPGTFFLYFLKRAFEQIYLCTYVYSINRSACGKVPHVALAKWSYFDESICGCSAGSLQIQVAKGMFSDAKLELKR